MPSAMTSGPTTEAAISIHSSLSSQVPLARPLSYLVCTNLLLGILALPGSSSHSVYITVLLKTPPWLPIALTKIKVSLRPLLTSATCLSLWFSASRSCSFCPTLISPFAWKTPSHPVSLHLKNHFPREPPPSGALDLYCFHSHSIFHMTRSLSTPFSVSYLPVSSRGQKCAPHPTMPDPQLALRFTFGISA